MVGMCETRDENDENDEGENEIRLGGWSRLGTYLDFL